MAALGGCYSNNDFAVMQSQINRLNAQLSDVENSVALLKSGLAKVKKQRVVKLPTGAPKEIRERGRQQPIYQSEEQQLFDMALSTYKAGNPQAAIRQFERFNNTYPNSKYHADVLYYLGDASHTVRDDERAQQVLEELIYQKPISQVNPKALTLLEKVYQARGEDIKIQELQGFMRTPTLSPSTVRPADIPKFEN